MKRLRYLSGWILVRPRRWLFHRMIWNYDLRMWPERLFEGHWMWPNPHWWILYWTVFKFFKWLNYDAWRPLCKWDRRLLHKPWYAAVIQRIGATTSGFAIHGGECFHCASKDGDQVSLTDDETGTTFRLERTWTVGTPDGTDHRFCGLTICPDCGYEDSYEDGSL